MSMTGSVTNWIEKLKGGEVEALGKLHARYWPQLVGLARSRLKGVHGPIANEEDLAQEAFWSFYAALKAGRVPRLQNRHHLLAILSHIIACRAVNQMEYELSAQKRGGGKVHNESAHWVSGERRHALELATSAEKTPLEQAILNDCYRHFVSSLPEHLRDFAELHLAGCTHKEIAKQLGCVERTVERKLAMIFKKWQQMAADSVLEEIR
jgi:RNA polymerase sigma factor (sigma-70 family)